MPFSSFRLIEEIWYCGQARREARQSAPACVRAVALQSDCGRSQLTVPSRPKPMELVA